MKTLEEIADSHLQLWFRDGASMPGDGKATLRERVLDAITEALDTRDDKWLASELRDAEHDRDGWRQAYMRRGEELRAIKQCRDDAIVAVHLACEVSRHK